MLGLKAGLLPTAASSGEQVCQSRLVEHRSWSGCLQHLWHTALPTWATSDLLDGSRLAASAEPGVGVYEQHWKCTMGW